LCVLAIKKTLFIASQKLHTSVWKEEACIKLNSWCEKFYTGLNASSRMGCSSSKSEAEATKKSKEIDRIIRNETKVKSSYHSKWVCFFLSWLKPHRTWQLQW